MSTEDTPGNVPLSEWLGLEPERAKVMLTLSDLGMLACTADRNGTTSAFVTVAMQWASEAQKEIERLREHAVILAATAEQVERERCAKLLRDMWDEREASHGNRAGPYHDGWTAALDLAERRLLGLGPNVRGEA